MYQFAGKIRVFNGHYWRELPVREKASTLQAATGAAVRNGLKVAKKQFKIHRVEAVSVTVERLGPVINPADVVVDTGEVDG